ncbi:MAG: UDP-3-O-(3-hydroxymyristoyl)glucosamine N-acyltransferase [Synechococcaceae cyanobacterium SM2_3_1]|nr:UDP-3-O-(3-hydroxymyristoyl)glucosamine N-acyltransferase [Synechococcaceae cyanobacterium SM2_3_1]
MKLHALAHALHCPFEGDPDLEIQGVAALVEAKPGDLSFVSESKFLPLLEQTHASAVLVKPNCPVPAGLAAVHSSYPRFSFAKAIELFYQPFQLPAGIHPTAVIAADAQLGAGVAIAAHVVVESGVIIGDYTQIHANVTLYPQVQIGRDCQLFANCVIHERSVIGDHCLIHSGAVIGDDGFGHVPLTDGSWYRMLQSGRVVLEEGVDVGANTTIDRPAVGETRIGRGTKIDNLVQVAHGVKIGPDSVLTSQVGISGGTTLGRHVVLGGQVGVAGHLNLGDNVTAVGQSGITNHVPAGEVVAGYPHQPHPQWKRSSVALRQLPDLLRTVRYLEKRLQELEASARLTADE